LPKTAARVEPVAQRDEVVEAGVARAQGRGLLGVQLAPVRTPVGGVEDPLGRREEPLVRAAQVGVHCDVRRVAAVRGRQRHVVRRRDADLDREAHRQPLSLGQGAQLADDVEHGCAGDGVLHLAEAHAARAGEDVRGRGRVGAGPGGAGHQAVEPRHQVRPGRAETADQAEGAVAEHLVLDERRRGDSGAGGPATRSLRLVSATSVCGNQ
jgi:hypothetical protein